MRLFVLIMTVCVVFASVAWSDEIVLTNGDRLTGKVEQCVDGKLVFNSALAGKITVDMANVKTLSTDEPVELHLNDGTVLKQPVTGAQDGRLTTKGSAAIPGVEFNVKAISTINPPVKPAPKWEGNLSAGIASKHGNTNIDTINASAYLSKRTEKDRTQLSGDYGMSSQKDPDTGDKITTEDWWKTKAKYDYFFSKKLYGYLDGRYESDKIAQLDRRVIVGGGAGYQWVESEAMNFSTEAGLASRYEKYDNQTDSSSEMSIQLGYHFDKKLASALKFIHDLTYYPATGSFNDYFLTANAELRADLKNNMFTYFKVLFDYDATPAQGQGSTDTKYIWGIGLRF